MKILYDRRSRLWCIIDNEGWFICAEYTPKEARRKARQWYMYLTTPDEEQAQKYLNGEVRVK